MKEKAPSPRPSIAPVLSFALVFWCGAASSWDCVFTMPLWAMPALLLAITVAYCLAKRCASKVVLARILVAAFGLGMALSLATALAINASRAYLDTDGGPREATFFVLEDERDYEYSNSCVALAFADGFTPSKVRVYFDGVQGRLFGQCFRASCSFSTPEASSLESANRKGIVFRCRLNSSSVEVIESPIGFVADMRADNVRRLKSIAEASKRCDGADVFLLAVLYADRSTLYDSDLFREVRCCGLAHLVAVSGAHLVIVSGFITALLDAFRVGRRLALGIQIFFLLGYLIMVGLPPSCMRASVMAVCSHLSAYTLRRPSALNSLGIALVVFLAVDPSLALSLSLQLSALATLGILLLNPLVRNWMEEAPVVLPEAIASPLSMTLCATLTTFPLTCGQFSQFALIAPVANVLATPILSLTCVLGVIAFFFQQVLSVNAALLGIALLIGRLFCDLCALLSTMPFSCIPVSVQSGWLGVATIALVASLWLVWPRFKGGFGGPTVFAILVITLSLVIPFDAGGTRITMLDVGQGDAILVQSEGRSLLVDTGNQPSMLLSALARAHVTELDAVVITHADDDHCGALGDLKSVVRVEEVILAKGTDEVEGEKCRNLIEQACEVARSDEPVYVSQGTVLRIGAWSCSVVWPSELSGESDNEDSICLLARADVDRDGIVDGSAFLCGDAEQEVLDELIDHRLLGDVDVYKVGHHGSREAVSAEQAAVMSPSISLVSVGAGNRYGHPNKEVVDTLREAGSEVYRTDLSGDVVCSFLPGEIRVSTMR